MRWYCFLGRVLSAMSVEHVVWMSYPWTEICPLTLGAIYWAGISWPTSLSRLTSYGPPFLARSIAYRRRQRKEYRASQSGISTDYGYNHIPRSKVLGHREPSDWEAQGPRLHERTPFQRHRLVCIRTALPEEGMAVEQR